MQQEETKHSCEAKSRSVYMNYVPMDKPTFCKCSQGSVGWMSLDADVATSTFDGLGHGQSACNSAAASLETFFLGPRLPACRCQSATRMDCRIEVPRVDGSRTERETHI